MVEIRRDNPNAFVELDLRLNELQGYEGRVGWAEDNKYPEGQQVAYIAQIQEYGHGKIPPRPFMRPAVKKNETRWKDYAALQVKRIIDGATTGVEAMRNISKLAAQDVQQSIEDVKSPPLSAITLWARYYRRVLNRPISGKLIGEIASKIKSGELRGVPPGISDKPLIDTERMMLGVIGEAVKV